MKTTIDHEEGKVRIDRQGVTPAAAGDRGKEVASHLTSEEVWREIAKASFAVIGYITPSGEPRSSGVVYKTIVRRLYVAVAPESWKARHIPASGRVAVTVPVRRGGILSLVVPIPPATVSFHGTAIVHPAGSPYVRSLRDELVGLLPAEMWASDTVIEVIPNDAFVTYGIGVSLTKMRDPGAARARVPVMQGTMQRTSRP